MTSNDTPNKTFDPIPNKTFDPIPNSPTSELVTPNRFIVDTIQTLPTAVKWMAEYNGITATYYASNPIDFPRWLFRMAELNRIHPSYVVDHTLEWYHNGYVQSEVILNILASGTVQSINHGYVFFSKIGITYHVVFVAMGDDRLEHIVNARQLINRKIEFNDKPMTFSEVLVIMGMEILPDYYK